MKDELTTSQICSENLTNANGKDVRRMADNEKLKRSNSTAIEFDFSFTCNRERTSPNLFLSEKKENLIFILRTHLNRSLLS